MIGATVFCVLHNSTLYSTRRASYRDEEGSARMNVMKNWGCLNKIKLVGILLAGRRTLSSTLFRYHLIFTFTFREESASAKNALV